MRRARRSESALPPGPPLPPVVQAMLRMWRFAEFRKRCYARYGGTYTLRVGNLPPSVLTSDRDAIRRLFSGDPLAKRHGNDLLRQFVGERSLLVLEPAEHLQRRRIVSPPFHGERVRSYAALMRQLVTAELDHLSPGETVAVQSFAQALTLDVILQAVLGISDRMLRQRLREVFDVLTTPRNSLAMLIPVLARRSRWNPLSRTPWGLMDELDALLYSHIAATRADPLLAQREDILAMLVTARNADAEGLSDEELRDELFTLITAGHETTATAIAWGAELLAHNPSVAQKARESDDEYLDAMVKEILRLHPPSPIGGARFVREPFQLGAWTIPAGVAILVDADGVHHDPAVYAQPQTFRPERFLDEPPDSSAFLPFGGGAHRCLGAALAQLEMKVVLRELLARFELAPISSEIARGVARGPTIAPRGGARVRLRTAAAVERQPQEQDRAAQEQPVAALHQQA